MVVVQFEESTMVSFKSTPPKSGATDETEGSNRVGREDGETDIVDVPQADGNSSVDSTDEKPAARALNAE